MTIIRIALPTYVLFVLIACVLGVLPIGAVAYVVAMNLIAYLTYWHDKRAAIKGYWRVSEHTLLTLSVMGGCMGAWLAQQQFRHKTQKKNFPSAVCIDYACTHRATCLGGVLAKCQQIAHSAHHAPTQQAQFTQWRIPCITPT